MQAHPTLVMTVRRNGSDQGLPGLGLEVFADVTRGVSWHIGALAEPGIPELLFTGREHKLLAGWAFPAMTAVQGAISDDDVAEFARGYARPGDWSGDSFTAEALGIPDDDVISLLLDGVRHYVALESLDALSEVTLRF